jgi:dipeptidyl aminopeptidase/acylaminoacyl peptidase
MANLLAHSDLFRAGIARSGSYDKTNQPFTFQSEVLFEAVRDSGATARVALLPFEDHGHQARESIEHLLHGQFECFNEHVKNVQSSTASTH